MALRFDFPLQPGNGRWNKKDVRMSTPFCLSTCLSVCLSVGTLVLTQRIPEFSPEKYLSSHLEYLSRGKVWVSGDRGASQESGCVIISKHDGGGGGWGVGEQTRRVGRGESEMVAGEGGRDRNCVYTLPNVLCSSAFQSFLYIYFLLFRVNRPPFHTPHPPPPADLRVKPRYPSPLTEAKRTWNIRSHSVSGPSTTQVVLKCRCKSRCSQCKSCRCHGNRYGNGNLKH